MGAQPPREATEAPVPQGPHRPDLAIAWQLPELRSGWRGSVDRFFGPGQTRAEVLVQLIGVPVLVALVLAHVMSADLHLRWSAVAVLVIFAIDAVGGVLTNSTGAAKRWYHRAGTRGERLRFVVLHVVHLALIAGLVLDQHWSWLALNAVLLIGLAVLIEHTPLPVRRPVAMGALLAAALLSSTLAPVPDGLSWIAPLLYLKLLVAHLVPEAPFARR